MLQIKFKISIVGQKLLIMNNKDELDNLSKINRELLDSLKETLEAAECLADMLNECVADIGISELDHKYDGFGIRAQKAIAHAEVKP